MPTFYRNKSWLLQSLKTHQHDKPRLNLLHVFDLMLNSTHPPSELAEELHQQKPGLIRLLRKQAKVSGAQLPDALAQQIFIMLDSALQQELQNPGSQAMQHARVATTALIHAQCDGSWRKLRDFGMSASFISLLGITLFMAWYMLRELPPVQKSPSSHQLWGAVAQDHTLKTSHVAAELYNMIERMHQGTCHFPQALMLNESERGVFLSAVMSGNLSSQADDLKLASQLLKKVNCEYKPLIMMSESEQAYLKAQLTYPPLRKQPTQHF